MPPHDHAASQKAKKARISLALRRQLIKAWAPAASPFLISAALHAQSCSGRTGRRSKLPVPAGFGRSNLFESTPLYCQCRPVDRKWICTAFSVGNFHHDYLGTVITLIDVRNRQHGLPEKLTEIPKKIIRRITVTRMESSRQWRNPCSR